MTRKEEQDAVPIPPQMLLAAYLQGVFPMAESRTSSGVAWYQPNPRAIIPLEQYHCPRSLKKIINQNRFKITIDHAFQQVVENCAEAKRKENNTRINEDIIISYTKLHEMGYAHSVEAWYEDELVGGLYGVSIGGAYFGESMFHKPPHGTHASKVCLYYLVQHLRNQGFALLDVQINNAHMAKFGVIEIPHSEYMELLNLAVDLDVDWEL